MDGDGSRGNMRNARLSPSLISYSLESIGYLCSLSGVPIRPQNSLSTSTPVMNSLYNVECTVLRNE
jgi:hypothetical protein